MVTSFRVKNSRVGRKPLNKQTKIPVYGNVIITGEGQQTVLPYMLGRPFGNRIVIN